MSGPDKNALIAEAKRLAKDVGEEVSVNRRFGESRLVALIADLKQKKSALSDNPDRVTHPSAVINGADDGAQGGPPPSNPTPVKHKRDPRDIGEVASGRALVGFRGTLGPGRGVRLSDFADKATFKQHVKRGNVIEYEDGPVGNGGG